MIGVWPIGTKVVLSDGRAGLVKEENEDDILSPKVEIEENKEIVDLKLLKDTLKIERYINPHVQPQEGKG